MGNVRAVLPKLPCAVCMTVGVIVASVAFVLELTLLPLSLPRIQLELGLNVGEVAWVFNLYAAAVAAAVLIGGLIGDRMDQRSLFSVGVALFIFGSILSVLSAGYHDLILGRAIQGFGGGLFSPLVPVLLTQANSERSGKMLMIWGGSVGFVAATIPLFGNLILTEFGWRYIFALCAFVALLAIVCVAIGERPKREALPQGAGGYFALFSQKQSTFLLFYIFLTYGCFSYFLFFAPFFWGSLGFDGQSISTLFAAVWGAFALASFLFRNSMKRTAPRIYLLAAPGIIAAGFFVSAWSGDSFVAQLLSSSLLGLGLACCNSPSTHVLLRIAPRNLKAFASSLDIIFARMGGVLVVAALSATGPMGASLAVAGLSFGAVCCCFFFVASDAFRN